MSDDGDDGDGGDDDDGREFADPGLDGYEIIDPDNSVEQTSTGDGVRIAGRYDLLSRLGVGGMGEVWRATDRLTQQTIAVKVLKPSIAGAPAAELRFQREIQAMVRLSHPRVVPVIDAGADPVVGLYFVMTLQRGRPLHEIAGVWRDWDRLWLVIDQTLEVLSYAHAHGVIHRDIKPDNVLVDSADDVVLLDFGVARLKDKARSGTSAYDMLGTVDYAAPEQATGNRRRIGPWTDLYCLGIVLYELICGRLPFWAPSPVQSLMLRLDHGCPPLEPRPGFATPVGLWDAMNRLMRPDPFERFIHAADARAAFAALASVPREMINPSTGHTPAPGIGQAPASPSGLTDDEAERLLNKRTARYAQSSDGTPISRPLEPPLRPASFLGRDNVLLHLSRGLERWRHQPQPGVLILTGPAGVGKSRLAEELSTPFMAAGQIDGHLHHWEPGQSVRHLALSITGALGMSDDVARRDHVDWWLGGHGVKDQLARHRMVEWCCGTTPINEEVEATHLTRFLSSACIRRPFVLTVDGMRTLDRAIVAVVNAVRANNLPCIIVVTAEAAVVQSQVQPPWLATAARPVGMLDDQVLDNIAADLVDLDEVDRRPLVYAADGSPRRLLEALNELRRRGQVIAAWPRWLRAPEWWEPPDTSLRPSR